MDGDEDEDDADIATAALLKNEYSSDDEDDDGVPSDEELRAPAAAVLADATSAELRANLPEASSLDLMQMKSGKAIKLDDFPNECLNALTRVPGLNLQWLLDFMKECWRSTCVPAH